MTLANTQRLIDSQGFTLAVNVIMLEHAEAYLAAAEQMGAGLVLQLSENTVRYHGSIRPLGKALLEIAQGCSMPMAIHLDHATDPELVREAADIGFTSVMFDGSKLDYGQNVETTARLVAEVPNEIWFEAELGEVGGKNGVHAPGVRTRPDEAVAFVAATNVDGLAVAVGSSHAMLEKSSVLDFELIKELASAVDVPLVLHGSSGVSHPDLKTAIKSGIKKVNIATELNAVFNAEVARLAPQTPGDPRKFLIPARESLREHLVGLHKSLL